MMLSQLVNCQPGNCGITWTDPPLIKSTAMWTDCPSIKRGMVISWLSCGLTIHTVMYQSSPAQGGQAALCLSPAMFHLYALPCNSVHRECTKKNRTLSPE